MSVLNRSMFQQAVNRQQGTPPMGENSTIFNFGEYGGTYDLKEPGFQRVLRNYLKEGEILFTDEDNFILSPAGMEAIDLFKQDIMKMQESKRAMGSPITGEGINGLKT